MTILLIILTALLAFASIGSAIAKLKKVPDVMTMMASVGITPRQVTLLAYLEIAGGLGLIVGYWSKLLGSLSAACLALYFAGAFVSHLRKKHKPKDFAAALGIFVIALLTTYLQLQR